MLAVVVYDKLCKHTSIAMVSGMEEVWPQPWYQVRRRYGRSGERLVETRLYRYLYSTHSLGTLSYNVGRFLEVGKTLCFQQYIKAERNIAKALMKLSEDVDLTQEVKDKLVSCVFL